MIKRELYLRRIRPFYHSDLIKVVLGIRRCGKSELIRQIRGELLDEGIAEERIVYINFEDMSYVDLLDAKSLHTHILKRITGGGKHYLLFDEIQLVHDFQRAVNSLKASQDVSIFLAGSNASILSGELATLLSGRYVSFKMMPLTFSEALKLTGTKGRHEELEFFYNYLKWGGLPQRFEFTQEGPVRNYLEDVLNSIIFQDILLDMRPADKRLTNRILRFMFENTGKIYSANRVYEVLKRDGESGGRNKVYELTAQIENAMAVSKCSRYDLRGKEVLTQLEKFYAADLGLRSAMNLNAEPNYGPLLETVVFNEFLARGYQVYIGKTYKGEVDFLVIDGDRRAYVQVAYTLSNESTLKREVDAFSPIGDHYKRYLISMDQEDYSTAGISHLSALEWLTQRRDMIF